MASGRSRGHGPVRGSIKGDEKYWIEDGRQERFHNYVMGFVDKTLNDTVLECPHCKLYEAHCLNITVMKDYSLVAKFSCMDCSTEFDRQITADEMQDYYLRDARKASSNPQEAEA